LVKQKLTVAVKVQVVLAAVTWADQC